MELRLQQRINKIVQKKRTLLRISEVAVSAIVLFATLTYGILALGNLLALDWSQTKTIEQFISLILLLMLGFELAHVIVAQSIKVVMQLAILVVARKMLTPGITSLDLLYSTIALAIVVAVYFLYKKYTSTNSDVIKS